MTKDKKVIDEDFLLKKQYYLKRLLIEHLLIFGAMIAVFVFCEFIYSVFNPICHKGCMGGSYVIAKYKMLKLYFYCYGFIGLLSLSSIIKELKNFEYFMKPLLIKSIFIHLVILFLCVFIIAEGYGGVI
ncbi:hypothetical protein AAEX28_00525 [Lentisphaerota bacterium WC36G]|nr:hypothetical protein LJT99_03405 [Lentisphaerae bacterium WC36]